MPNKRDREKLRARVKAGLDRSGLTQKDLEKAAGWSSGTLSRVFAGKKNPDAELFRQLADQLATTPAEIVAGTGFAELFADDRTVEGAPERATEPEPNEKPDTTEESGPAETTQESEPVVLREEPVEPTVEAPEPTRESAPAPAPQAADAPPPADARGPQPEWKPPPEPRKRKRDLPFRVVRWVASLVFGD